MAMRAALRDEVPREPPFERRCEATAALGNGCLEIAPSTPRGLEDAAA